MTRGVTTSVRLDPDLRAQLQHAAQVMHRGKSWIINHALQKYLAEIETVVLAKEAKRQSLLAASLDKEHDAEWDDFKDTSGWE